MRASVIASYPEAGSIHGTQTVGGASYTKNTLTTLSTLDPHFEATVYAEIFDKPRQYQEGKITVNRVWKRNNLGSLLRLFNVLRRDTTQTLVVSLEIFMFGSLFHLTVFLVSLLALKLGGKRIVLILHQVPDAPIVRLYYAFLLMTSTVIVVFEEHFKELLGNNAKVVCIPHAVEPVRTISQSEARKRLGLVQKSFYALYFGFLSPYKGAQTLVREWPIASRYELILAGGANPNHTSSDSYMKFVDTTLHEAKEKGILTTGFVPEEKINDYFAASDVVILPYQSFFSSSGPLALAVAHEKPFLLSPVLADYFKSGDFQQAAIKSGIAPREVVLSITSDSIVRVLENIGVTQQKRVAFSQELKRVRDWKHIGKDYLSLLQQMK